MGDSRKEGSHVSDSVTCVGLYGENIVGGVGSGGGVSL
jgi:hypothetical protein